jgi:histidinol phosphatase-like PHP family hydrolase
MNLVNHWPRTDMHLHATYYRLESAREDMTVTNIVRHLEAEGYNAAGIVEHLDATPKHPIHCLEALVAEFRSLSSSLDLFVGAELDYERDGITIAEAQAIKRRLGLDFYFGAAHGVGKGVTSTAAYIEEHHRRLMGITARCDFVDIVAHPWSEGHKFASRGQIEAWRFELIPENYLREFIDAARHHSKAIEINRRALADADDPAFQSYLQMLCDSGTQVTIGSDAHAMEWIDAANPLNALLQEAGFGPERLWRPSRE